MTVTVVGWLGAVALLAAYLMLLRGRVDSRSPAYLALNLAGSAGLALSTAAAHVWPSSAVNIVWLMIGIGPLWRAISAGPLRRPTRRRPGAASTSLRSSASAQRLGEVGEDVAEIFDAHREAHQVGRDLQW
ncbi:MAG: hypothetical protein JO147_11525 [Actinobacteria bacterium]|nr:hypothetical protein [Actinomycetota bacterium]